MLHCASPSTLTADTITVVVLTDMPMDEATAINSMLRSRGVKSVYSGVYGVCGVMFADLLNSTHDLDPLGKEQTEVILPPSRFEMPFGLAPSVT